MRGEAHLAALSSNLLVGFGSALGVSIRFEVRQIVKLNIVNTYLGDRDPAQPCGCVAECVCTILSPVVGLRPPLLLLVVSPPVLPVPRPLSALPLLPVFFFFPRLRLGCSCGILAVRAGERPWRRLNVEVGPVGAYDLTT